ncbi:Sec-independent protein translocase TatB, partial [Thiopseudomonas sp. 4R-3cl]
DLAAAVGGAAAALMASGRAEALAEERPAAVETEPDPLELLGLAPAPFDVDAT